MPSVFVLYLQDEVVAPHLELLRNICEPESRSRPHITVRYFDKLAIPDDYLNARVDHIELLGVDSFGIDDGTEQENRTIFIRCQSHDLLRLEHKPFFPTSQFHITLYDGKSDQFARALLRRLSAYKWHIRVPLPSSTPLTQIEIRPKRKKKSLADSREYSQGVAHLFKRIAKRDISFDYLISLSEQRRLDLVEAVCKSLARSTKQFAEVSPAQARESVEIPKEDESFEMHLTPPELAAEITSYALSLLDPEQKQKIDFGDPAVGTGAFYAALLAAVQPECIRSAIGIDISPSHVAAAKWRWESKGMRVIERDYLGIGTLSQRNLILANPPYLRHQGIPAKYKHELRHRASLDLGMRISGLSGQYLYFLLLSHKWMAPDAVAAWLIPSEFMQTSYGSALRYYLTRRVQLLRIHQFAPKVRQFENAEALPCVVVFRNRAPQSANEVLFTIGGTLSQPAQLNRLAINDLSPDGKWTLLARPVKARDESYVRLGDLFEVRRGIATGANEFFVLERKVAADLGIPPFAVKPILPKAKTLTSEVIESDEDGYPAGERQLCVIDCDLDEATIRSKFPGMMAYLETAKEEGVLSRHLVARRKPWYKQERRAPALFLCTYMGKAHGDKPAIRFMLNKSKALATNTYLMLYPTAPVRRLIERDENVVDELFSLLKNASGEAMQEFLRTHAGGLSKIEPRELLEVRIGPLPAHLRAVASLQLFP